jgi:multidrug efflux pump subunit AcrA (membrane-fusion protein)
MAKRHNIEINNEEVREIMKEIPGSIIHWGLTVIFLIFASIIVGSYFFKFREIVTAPLIITTTNPPAPIICKASGRIERWFVSDGLVLDKGENIALIQNSTDLEDFQKAEQTINLIDPDDIRSYPDIVELPEKLVLGELQEAYNQFYRNWESYRNYLENDFLSQKIELLRRQMEKQQQQYELSLQQKEMIEKEMEFVKNELKRYEGLLNKGGVSESQLEEAKSRVIQSERSYTNFLASLKSTEINLISQRRSLLELEEQNIRETRQYESNISDNIRTLKNMFSNWRDRYLLSSPVRGKITLTRFWSENHVVSAGDRLATVVPVDSSVVICRAVVSSSGIGKIESGQKVHIKLSGYPYM